MSHESRPGLSLKSNFAWTLFGNLAVAGCQFGLLSVIAHTTSDRVGGQFGIALAIATPLFLFAGLDLRMLQATDVRSEYRFAECLALRLLLGLVALALLPLISLFRADDLSTFLVLFGVGLAKLFELGSDACYSVLQKHERMDRVSHSLLLHGICSTLPLALVTAVTGSLVGGVFVAAGVQLALLLTVDLRLAARVSTDADRPALSWAELKAVSPRRLLSLGRLGGPLGVRTLLISLNAQATRYFVEGRVGLAELGVFNPIVSAVSAATTISKALNHAVSGRLGRAAANSNRQSFRRLMRQLQGLYLGLGLLGVAATWLVGRQLLELVFPPHFASQHLLFVLVSMAVAVQYHGGVLDLGLVALRRADSLAPLSGLSLAVTAVACWLLIPVYGLNGAGAAMILSRLVRSAIMLPLLMRHSRDVSATGAEDGGESSESPEVEPTATAPRIAA